MQGAAEAWSPPFALAAWHCGNKRIIARSNLGFFHFREHAGHAQVWQRRTNAAAD
jgi:hypothetical protein